jgi:NAD(P)-dependent dehydrogenase (short-subunit alcohol dehydrogenase family)
MRLAERVIAVTGGSGALGQAVVKQLMDEGARVVVIDLSDQAPALHHPASLLFQGGVDAGDESAMRQAFATAVSHFGTLNGLVNVAGGFAWETLEGGSLDTWDRLNRMNLRSAVAACMTALPHLKASGNAAIVNVGALGAVKAASGMGAYAASKAGVARLTESLAEELKDQGVRVNAVLPSIIDTAANRADMPDADFTRWVSPEALASVIAFLLSEEARAVNGALLPVSGRV